jgi:spore coat polysaccharide biosynthesis protein SpsF (cytidylyltransferase family)
MNNFGIIIEARTGSKRLPNKILKRVNKKTILDYLVKRVKTQKKIKKIIISTTTLK